jgi:hypothetical protein
VLDGVLEHKRKWDQEFERRRALGITGPDPIPHPDHLKIDIRAGKVTINGPMTKEEAYELEVWRRYKGIFEDANEGLRSLLADQDYEAWTAEEMEEQIRLNQQCIERIEQMLRIGRPLPLPIRPEELGI